MLDRMETSDRRYTDAVVSFQNAILDRLATTSALMANCAVFETRTCMDCASRLARATSFPELLTAWEEFGKSNLDLLQMGWLPLAVRSDYVVPAPCSVGAD